MEKKNLFKIFILVFTIILFIITLLIFSEKINTIELINNIKQATAKKEDITNEITIIDVTNLEDNNNIKHEHILKTMYDENSHWNECTICGEKNNETNHSYTRTWALGYESCYYTNSYTDVCSCGYSKKGKKPCIWNGSAYIGWTDRNHDKKCSVCNYCIRHEYYWNNKLYNYTGYEDCYTSNGVRLDCSHKGQCSKCKINRDINEHRINMDENNDFKCIICKKKYGEVTNIVITTDNAKVSPTYTVETTINLMNGATYDSLSGIMGNTEVYDIKELKLVNKISSTQFTISAKVRIKNTIKYPNSLQYGVYINLGGKRMYIYISDGIVLPDLEKPVILDITMNNNEELTEWSKTKPIIISGTENYCNIVTVKIEDEQGEIIFNGSGNVTNNNFSVSCIPEIECDTNGKKFIVTVTDTCQNNVIQEFKIAKIDLVAPKPISENNIEGDWAKSKNFTFKATDKGIGNVSIAFNDIEDLKLAKADGEEYSRQYQFIGDVYQPKELSVLYKDELENATIQKITIDKLDNTKPTITNVELKNNKLIINSHDKHEILGEGSGVVKYKYLASREKLDTPLLTAENSIEVEKNDEIKVKEIYKIKYIYIIAEDLVGNTSDIYEFKVPELILKSTVNLNTSNEKGEVILDWSGYNIIDKYFVIYRKQEDQEKWEKIVDLQDKLTGNTYTDVLGNDKAKPDVVNISINEDKEKNSINMSITSIDNGSKYIYYIEAYDSTNTNILINKSNIS